jgi:hypothetical protein
MTTTEELQPDVPEVLQSEEPAGAEPVVKVTVEGPVRTQALPRKAGSTKTAAVTTTPFRILTPNPRRSSVVLIADAVIYVALSRAAAQVDPASTAVPPTMAQWPANVPLTVTADVDVLVAAKTGTANVSVVVEYWATGEGAE